MSFKKKGKRMNKGLEKIPVSKTKLYDALNKRGLTPTEASKEIGFGRDYLSNAVCTGYISARGALYLDKFFSIKPEDYQPDLLDMVEKRKPETPEQIPNEIIQTAAETFARTIVEAYRDTYRKTLRETIVEALKERGI